VGAEIERGISGSYQGEIDANLSRLQAYKCHFHMEQFLLINISNIYKY